MTKIGFHASHEQFAPGRLLACAKRAQDAGFDAGMCSEIAAFDRGGIARLL